LENIDKFWFVPLFFHFILSFIVLKVFFKKLKKKNLVFLTIVLGLLIFVIEETVYVRTLTSQNLDSKYINESRAARENDFLSFEQNIDYLNCIHTLKTLGLITCKPYYYFINKNNEEKYRGDSTSFNLESRKEGYRRRLGLKETKSVIKLKECNLKEEYFSPDCRGSFLLIGGLVHDIFDLKFKNRTEENPEKLFLLINETADKAIRKLTENFDSLSCNDFNIFGSIYGQSVYSENYPTSERRSSYLKLKLKSCFKRNCRESCLSLPGFYSHDGGVKNYFNSFIAQVLVEKHLGVAHSKEHHRRLKVLKNEYHIKTFDDFYNYLLKNYPKEFIVIGQHKTSREFWEFAYNSSR
jgi:hypothetical protein